MLTIMPSSGSISGRLRFAAPVPTSRSCCPVYRYSSAAKPAYMVENSDTRCCRLNERNARDSSAGTRIRGAAPRMLMTDGRGRSAGSSSRSGASASSAGPVVHVRPQHRRPASTPVARSRSPRTGRRGRAAATAGRPRTPRTGSTARTAAPPATIHRGRSGAPRGRRCSRRRRGAAAASGPAAAGSGRTACAARRRSTSSACSAGTSSTRSGALRRRHRPLHRDPVDRVERRSAGSRAGARSRRARAAAPSTSTSPRSDTVAWKL